MNVLIFGAGSYIGEHYREALEARGHNLTMVDAINIKPFEIDFSGIDTVINVRIPNPFMPDTPQRIATDTSQKLAIRFGETIKAYAASDSLNVANLKHIPLVFAGWLRYLMAVDDNGNSFTPSSDPLLESASVYVKDFELSATPKDLSKLDALLSNEKVFGVNLIANGMADIVKKYFAELSVGTGAVKATLEKYVM